MSNTTGSARQAAHKCEHLVQAAREATQGGIPPIGWGMIGMAGLLLFYMVVVGVASRSLDHALELMWDDRYYIAAITAGFGIQAGLMAFFRRAVRGARDKAASAAGATGTGASTASMIACCAHHVADLAPFLSASGLVIFLNDYRYQVMLVGIAVNLLGIVFLIRRMSRLGILPWQTAAN